MQLCTHDIIITRFSKYAAFPKIVVNLFWLGATIIHRGHWPQIPGHSNFKPKLWGFTIFLYMPCIFTIFTPKGTQVVKNCPYIFCNWSCIPIIIWHTHSWSLTLHNIIQSHNNVLRDWQYYTKYSSHSVFMWGVFSRTDNILQNISHIHVECENILHNIFSPAKHCYGSE